MQRRSKELLDNDELKSLYSLLESNAGTQSTPEMVSDPSGVRGEDSVLLNYAEFKTVKESAGEKCRGYFTAKIFAKLQVRSLTQFYSVCFAFCFCVYFANTQSRFVSGFD